MNPYILGFFTGMHDSDGAPIHVGDTVEYFQECYAFEEEYRSLMPGELVKDYRDIAIKGGFTAFHEYTIEWQGVKEYTIRAYKPCVGVVNWNGHACTFEPLIDSHDDYYQNCFRVLINNYPNTSAYCRVIKKWND